MMRWLLAFVLIVAFNSSAFAQLLLASCGSLQGHSYYFYDEANPKGREGWIADGMSNGSIRLMRLKDGGYDLLVKDSVSERSLDSEGFVISPVLADFWKKIFIITVSGDKFAGIYTFKLDKTGKGQMTFSQSKSDKTSTSAFLFTAKCTEVE